MRQLSVVLPTWDMRRALTRCAEMMTLESRIRKAFVEYVIVVPKAENLAVGEWVNGLDPEDAAIHVIETTQYLSPVEAMAIAGADLLQRDADLIAFLHDDVIIEQEGWEQVVLEHFSAHPRCGLAGFGGGLGFAHADIYKVPYDYRQLARIDFVSNMREAEHHGRRVKEAMRVAALDGFALITSREFYEKGGYIPTEPADWQTAPMRDGVHIRGAWDACLRDDIPFHEYDAWISCRAAELGYETWMLPIACHHQGGQTSVTRQQEYAGVLKRLGYSSPEDLYERGHRAVYERFGGLLPIRITKEER